MQEPSLRIELLNLKYLHLYKSTEQKEPCADLRIQNPEKVAFIAAIVMIAEELRVLITECVAGEAEVPCARVKWAACAILQVHTVWALKMP